METKSHVWAPPQSFEVGSGALSCLAILPSLSHYCLSTLSKQLHIALSNQVY